jgi:hypothetical protein
LQKAQGRATRKFKVKGWATRRATRKFQVKGWATRPNSLREKAHESRKYFIVNELVYVADVGGPQDDSNRLITKIYLKLYLRMEVKLCLFGQRNTQQSIIFEILETNILGRTFKMKNDFRTIGGDSPMLVEVTHSV